MSLFVRFFFRCTLPVRYATPLVCLLLAHTATAQDVAKAATKPETVRLQLKWNHQFQFAGYYAALAKGYYEEAGFSVTLLPGSANLNPREAVLSGEAEFGVAGSDLMLGHLNGEPVVALASIFQHSAYALLALESSGIRNPGDLAGRRIMLRNGAPSTEIYSMLERSGVRRSDFTELPLTFRHEDLLDNKADAMSVYLTDQPFFDERPDSKYVLIRPLAFGVDFYGDTLFTSRSFVHDHPDRVKAFRNASLKGWRYAMENPGEIIAWIQHNYPGLRSDAQLISEAEQMQSLIMPDLIPLGQMNPERWERIALEYQRLGMSTGRTQMSEFLFEEDPGLDPATLRKLLWFLVPLAAIVASWIAFLILFNKRLASAVLERTASLESLNGELQAEVIRRGEAEEAFRIGEDYYRSLLERLPVGLALSKMTGELIFVNDAYASMLGRTVTQTLGLSYWDLTPEDFRAQEKIIFAQLVEAGRVDAFEKEYIHADGHRFPVRLSAILLDRGSETLIWAFAEDITKVRAAERALRQQEEQYRIIFESIPLGLIISNADGTTSEINPAAHNMHGYTRDEFLALRPDEFVHPSSLTDFERCRKQALAGGDFFVRARDTRKDGSILEIEVTGVAFHHHGMSQHLGIIQDITARVRAEEALQLSEEKFRTIVETTTEWIWEIDLEGRHTYCNPALESILGYTSAEFLGVNSMELIHPDDAQSVAESLPEFIANGTGWRNWVLRWQHKNGSWRHLESNAEPILNSHGTLIGFRGVDRDITDRIEAERLLRVSMDALAFHQEQLEELVRERTAALEKAQSDLLRKERLATLGQLIGTVSHEIRNPLGTIRGSVFSIGQLLKKQDYSRIETVLVRAERNIVRCDRIIEELLDFTRTRRLEQQVTALDGWLSDLLEDISFDGEVDCDRQFNADAMIRIDREQFRRAMLNLINNATQAMEHQTNKHLRIATSRVGREALIEITDQGSGIAPEHMEKIFEPLFSTKGFGVGLGIPIIKDIVDAHGGRLKYESAVGKGTTVRIWLPVM